MLILKKKKKKKNTPSKQNPPLITGLEKKQPDREDTGSLSKELTEQALFDIENIYILANIPRFLGKQS